MVAVHPRTATPPAISHDPVITITSHPDRCPVPATIRSAPKLSMDRAEMTSQNTGAAMTTSMLSGPMRFAYADPPYLGCGKLYLPHHPQALDWDDPDRHQDLIWQLGREYPDGWALSASSTSLPTILPMCPAGVRIAAWVKPFAAFKRNVRVAYTWEPVIFSGGRMSSATGAIPTRDHISQVITLKRGLAGAKPERFVRWVLDLLGYIDGDTVDDLFPGTEVLGKVTAQKVLTWPG